MERETDIAAIESQLWAWQYVQQWELWERRRGKEPGLGRSSGSGPGVTCKPRADAKPAWDTSLPLGAELAGAQLCADSWQRAAWDCSWTSPRSLDTGLLAIHLPQELCKQSQESQEESLPLPYQWKKKSKEKRTNQRANPKLLILNEHKTQLLLLLHTGFSKHLQVRVHFQVVFRICIAPHPLI